LPVLHVSNNTWTSRSSGKLILFSHLMSLLVVVSEENCYNFFLGSTFELRGNGKTRKSL
jgi:hypothetical protein